MLMPPVGNIEGVGWFLRLYLPIAHIPRRSNKLSCPLPALELHTHYDMPVHTCASPFLPVRTKLHHPTLRFLCSITITIFSNPPRVTTPTHSLLIGDLEDPGMMTEQSRRRVWSDLKKMQKLGREEEGVEEILSAKQYNSVRKGKPR